MVTIGDPWVSVPRPSDRWREMPESARLALIQHWLGNGFTAVSASATGAVTITMPRLSAAERGKALRDIETTLRDIGDPAIVVFLAPQADRNRLRQLRGVRIE